MDIIFTVRLTVKNAIDEDALREDYHDNPLEYIRFLVEQEGLQGCTEDDFEIVTATTIPNTEDDQP